MSGVISDNTVTSSGAIAPVTSATTDANNPAVDTNPTDGVGTKWINTTSGQIFICIDATTDENEWIGQTISSIQPRCFFSGGNSDYLGEHNWSYVTKITDITFVTPDTLGDAVSFGALIETNQYFCGTSNGVNDRGVFGGGAASASPTNVIQYFTCSTSGNCIDFGNLDVARVQAGACSNGTTDRACWSGGGETGTDVASNVIDYITISTTGNATDFGNLTNTKEYTSALSNGTNDRGINAGGIDNGGSPHLNEIDYWTISTTGNAQDFGNLTNTIMAPATASNDTDNRGLIMAGSYGGSFSDKIDYITISSTGNAADFGDMDGADMGYGQGSARGHCAGNSSGLGQRGMLGGGYSSGGGVSNWYKDIRYVTISTTGNGAFFGNLSKRVYGPASCDNTFV
jgi:hypothetical protein